MRLRAWDGSRGRPGGGARPGRPLPAGAAPAGVGARASWGWSRATWPGRSTSRATSSRPFAALSSVGRLASPGGSPGPRARERLRAAAHRGCALGAARAASPRRPPRRSPSAAPAGGTARGRDAAAVTHHYDVGNDFYALVLGPSMVYSCAVWDDEDTGLDAAQEAKLDLVCRKLGLRAGDAAARRRLRLGQPGAARRAAVRRRRRRHHAVAPSRPTWPASGSAEAGLDRPRRHPRPGLPGRRRRPLRRDQLDRHGRARRPRRSCPATSPGCTTCCGPAAGCSTTPSPGPPASTDLGRRHVHRPLRLPRRRAAPRSARRSAALEDGGLEVLDVEALRQHYALTLRAWVAAAGGALGRRRWRLTSEGRARVWRLYMAASRAGLRGRAAWASTRCWSGAAVASRCRCACGTGSDGKDRPSRRVTVDSPARARLARAAIPDEGSTPC